MKNIFTHLVLLAIAGVGCHAYAQTAPGTVPTSSLSEVLHWVSIISGYNVLMSALQGLFSKGSAPSKVQLVAGVKAVGTAVVQAAETAAVAQAAQMSAPALTGIQTASAAALSLIKVLSANPDVPPTPAIVSKK